jgi:hypothetical protein
VADGGYAVLEIMGHRQIPGFVSEVEFAGVKMVRVQVPSLKRDGEGKVVGLDLEHLEFEQRYGASAVFCLTPATEEQIARLLAREWHYRPELPAAPTAMAPTPEDVRPEPRSPTVLTRFDEDPLDDEEAPDAP